MCGDEFSVPVLVIFVLLSLSQLVSVGYSLLKY